MKDNNINGGRTQKLRFIRHSRAYKMIREPVWHFLAPRAHKSRSKLRQYANKHAGETCYIIGGGPSLLKTDFNKLQGKLSIGLNRLYLGFDQFNFQPTYMACVNELLMTQWGHEFEGLDQPLFTGWSARAHAPDSSIMMRTRAGTRFSDNLVDQVSVGSTVTYVALQLAYWMGCEKVVLVGIDHNYHLQSHEESLPSHAISERKSADKSHFSEQYFDKGSKWQLPDLEQSEQAYTLAKQFYEKNGRKIVDATVGGQLNIFEKTSNLSDI